VIANPAGFYSGVSLRGKQAPPRAPAKTGDGPAILTWTGFERTPTGSRVFFQLSSSVEYRIEKKPRQITVHLPKAKVPVRNNTRRLDLHFFATPVDEVKVHRRGAGALATLKLKHEAEPAGIELVDGPGGYKLLVISFSHEGQAKAPPKRPPPRAR
jgi:hypothetical protein